MSMFGEKIEEYEILEHLGKGGFANVYRARCRRTGLFVAIKMIDKALMASAGMIGRVRQEVTIHSRLKHPAILELFTFFEDAHYVYLVLELAHNGELAKHFKLGTRGLSEKAAADIFRQVVSGVLYLHTHNIIHRDLSLNNLLLTKDLNVKIADFGLATQLNGPDEKHVTMCGTPNYISPEVASRELHGLPADVWGLGCMLYTLLVGRPPFHTQHVKTTLNKVINADYKIPPELSLPAQDLLLKLLCKDPIKRITLKEIMEHPFITSLCSNNSNVTKQDISRDSGFLTTLHSTQHSGKIRHEDRTSSDYQCSSGNVEDLKHKASKLSYNVFAGMQENCTQSSNCHSYDYKMCMNSEKGSEIIDFQAQLQPSSSILPQKNDNSSEQYDIKKMNINCITTEGKRMINCGENKENIPKSCNSTSNAIGVPPLCAERLPVISHRTRNAILKIEPTAVIVEFIKKKGKDREEKVVEICKITKDGMKIIIYSVDNIKEKYITPFAEHNPSPDEVFSYHNLPQKHWKKYLYASRFVELVKAKTPKITLYSSLAKCQLMENNVDMEIFFYNGEKVAFVSTEGLKVIDKNSKTYHNPYNVPELKYLLDHYEECSNRIKRIQSALSCISDECFPLIIGKRPVQTLSNTQASSPLQGSVNANYNSPLFNVGSFHRTAASSSHAHSDFNNMF
ncbi:serine/threonine-protein kinase PLK4 [Ostrinia furnacalis]|uniref:serine/threonine-protein kinase PLK4 n=1 Tax=Ostrinia furnacalis TaxID=93504 RepID=UPI00103ECD9F|nr:serine/threonine-protein kinase PLK4 [Ostrinia furnacalis]